VAATTMTAAYFYFLACKQIDYLGYRVQTASKHPLHICGNKPTLFSKNVRTEK
jgi:hypothetical protein